jgi:hypothetical protein
MTFAGDGAGDARRAIAGTGPMLVLLVVGIGLIAGGIVLSVRDGDVREHGVAVDATLVARSFSLRGPDRIRVAWATPDGQVVDRRFAVGSASAFRHGDPVPVRYDASDPGRAALVHGAQSRALYPGVFGGAMTVGAGIGLVLWGRAVSGRYRPWRRQGWKTAAVVLGVVGSTAVLTGVVSLPAVHAAPPCGSPPAPIAGAGAVPEVVLEQALAPAASGFTVAGARALKPTTLGGVYSDPAVARQVVAEGFRTGWLQWQTQGQREVLTFALQFANPAEARHFEAERTVALCAYPHRGTFDTGAPASAGQWRSASSTGPAQSRVVLLRGSRAYYIEELGAVDHYPAELRALVTQVSARAT